MTGQNIGDFLQQQAGGMNASSLLGLAGAGPIGPGSEMQFRHQTAGGWGDQGYKDLLHRAQAGDPQAVQDFVSGIQVYTGETGANKVNQAATDSYRRSLVNQLPQNLQQQLLQNPNIFPDAVPGLADSGKPSLGSACPEGDGQPDVSLLG